MDGHAAAAEWLRTLPWWDWRGWSDWFFGGQAIGVNYPPLAHAWMRFTHPVHGQMAAVALGLLVLLPWGALLLARAVGCTPRAQRGAVAAVLVLAAASGEMHWVLSGFHQTNTFFGSWPAMVATVLGLFCAAWAARCRAPVACGAVAAVAILFNATVVPGVAVVCVALLATSGCFVARCHPLDHDAQGQQVWQCVPGGWCRSWRVGVAWSAGRFHCRRSGTLEAPGRMAVLAALVVAAVVGGPHRPGSLPASGCRGSGGLAGGPSGRVVRLPTPRALAAAPHPGGRVTAGGLLATRSQP